MFGLRKTERRAFEAHIESLQSEIHWLRSCIPWAVPVGHTAPAVGAATPPPLAPVDDQDDEPDPTRSPLSPMSEEEEDVYDAVRRGDLDEEEAKAILKVLGHTAVIEFE